MFTLTIPAGHKPGACADPSAARFALGAVLCYARGEQTYLASCNGRALAVLPVGSSAPPAEPILLPPDGINGKARSSDSVEINGCVRRLNGKKMEEYALPEQAGMYPNFRDVLPVLDSSYTVVSLSARDLGALASAISANGFVTLFVPPMNPRERHVTKPLIAIGQNDAQPVGVGLLMPCAALPEGRSREFYATVRENAPDQALRFVPPTATGPA